MWADSVSLSPERGLDADIPLGSAGALRCARWVKAV